MAKRRANHEGSIYKRQDGRWVASVTLPGGTRKSFYGSTRAAVAQKLTVGLKAVQDGLPVPSDQLKVGRYLQEWLQSAQPGVRPSTWRRYEQLLRVHALPAGGALPLSRLEPRHLQRLYADCLTAGLAPATVRQLHAVLRRALEQATRWGSVARNVAALVSAPRVHRYEMTPLTPDQARSLLDAAPGDRFAALYVLALTTGMRLGELLGLRWRDVELAHGMLQVRHTLLRLRDGLKLREPKTPQSRRRIALTRPSQP
jgi:integrase